MRSVHQRQQAGSLKRGLAAVALATVATSTSGCATHGLSFVTDTRVEIVAPEDRSALTLPVTVRWTARDVATGPGEGHFGVFVDRAPPPPGRTPAWLFRDDAACKGRGRARCATPEFLADRQIFLTDERAVTIERIAELSGNDKRREFHEVTVVLLDAAGARVKESAWSVQFSLDDRR